MRLTCPSCAATYEVAESAIGPNGRKVRCRACGASWFEAPPATVQPAAPAATAEAPPPLPALAVSAPLGPAPVTGESGDAFAHAPPFTRPGHAWRGPLLLGALVLAVLLLGAATALIAWGPRQVAGALGLAERPVPLGIAITHQPDWRMIAGGSELFAVSGRIWNPTATAQPVPDVKAELKDARGRTVYSWTITRPVAQLGPGASIDFDGAAVDVPRSSQRIAVTFARGSER